MKLKQIYAALDIGSYEVKLIVGEFHNTRLNVIRVECVPCSGIERYQIVDANEVSRSIMQAVKNVNDLLNVRIERVLLSIPPYQLRRKSQKVGLQILHDDHRIQLIDIQNAIKLANRTDIPEHLITVNAVPVKYFVNGIATRRLPINEVCDRLDVDIDLFCINKKLVYSYVRCVEHSGLEIIDIFAQPYAEAKEATIFEQSIKQYVMYINIGYEMSNLTLFYEGRLNESISLGIGTKMLDTAIMEQFKISQEVADRLKKYSTHLTEADISDDPIYIWSANNKNCVMTERQLYDTIINVIDNWLYEFRNAVHGLFELEHVKIVLGGGGAEIFELATYASARWDVETKTYIPDTMGARTSALIGVLGLFYAYKDACEYTLSEKTSIDTLKFAESILPSKSVEDGFTGRLRGLLFNENKEKNKE